MSAASATPQIDIEGRFRLVRQFGNGWTDLFARFVDLDGDGRRDHAYGGDSDASDQSYIAVHIDRGNGAFDLAYSYSTVLLAYPSAIAGGDLDADGVHTVHDAIDGFRPLGRGPAVAPPLLVRAIPSGELLVERDDAWMLIAIDGTPLSSWQPLHDFAQSTRRVLGFHGARRLWRLDLLGPNIVPQVSLRRSDDLGETFDASLRLVPFPDADAFTVYISLNVVDEHTALLAWRGALGRATVQGPCH
jgi:hypothetical protein